jgi:hypothetical protein
MLKIKHDTARLVQRYRRAYRRQTMRSLYILLFRNSSLLVYICSYHCHVLKHLFVERSVGVQQPKSGLGLLTGEVYRSYTGARAHTQVRAPCRTTLHEWSAHNIDHFLHNTHETQETKIHTVSGIRTSNPTHPAAADLRLLNPRPPRFASKTQSADSLFHWKLQTNRYSFEYVTIAFFYDSISISY